jgi:hypothetical protein
LRRIAILAAVAAALTCATAASSALQPLRRAHAGELRASKLRPVPRIPAQHENGRIRVIARLDVPPLAAAYAEGLSVTGSSRRLDVNSSSSHKYLSRLDSMQKRAAAEIREAIPSAMVSRRFQVVLDGCPTSHGSRSSRSSTPASPIDRR